MRIVRLKVLNFRGIQSATLHFDDHTLLVGANNVGKSTICEALDLALGLDGLGERPRSRSSTFIMLATLTRLQTHPLRFPSRSK